MANILIFRNDEIAGEYDNGYVSKWNTELARAFEQLGYNVYQVNFLDKDLLQKLNEIFKEKISFAFAFNWVYFNCLKLLYSKDKINVLNYFDIPLVNWFWDGICVGTNPAMRVSGINNLICAVMNEDEVKEVRSIAPHIKQVFCLPLSGGQSKMGGGELLLLKDRKYHISFIGNYTNFYDRNFDEVPRTIAKLLNEIIDVMIDDPLTPAITALRKVLSAKNMEVSKEWFNKFCLNFLNFANLYVRGWSRLKLIRTLTSAGIAIDIWGGVQGKESLGWKNEKFINHHGGCSTEDSFNVMANSQMLLNNGMFPGGLHDRIISGMLNGSVVLTDPSTYYHKHFVDGEDSLTFDWKHIDELPEKIVKLMPNEDNMQSIAMAGRNKAMKFHTWKNRAEKIIEQVQIYHMSKMI